MENLEAELERHFGHAGFRSGQRQVVETLLEGRSALAVFPTGGGKSLCYQLPAILLDGLTLVVSPLIALMKDQVDVLVARGIAAARLDSTLTAAEVAEVYESMVNGTLKLLYVAPERFVSETFVARIKRAKIGLLAIDEAHCISEWGHNFRPEYLRLAALAKNSESSVCLLSRPQLRRRWSRKSALVFGSRRRTAFRHPFFGGIWPCTSPLFRPTSGFRF